MWWTTDSAMIVYTYVTWTTFAHSPTLTINPRLLLTIFSVMNANISQEVCGNCFIHTVVFAVWILASASAPVYFILVIVSRPQLQVS